MEIRSAIDLINDQVAYKDGWEFEAVDHSARFEGCVQVKLTFPVTTSERQDRRSGRSEPFVNRVTFPLVVADLDFDGLLRAVFGLIVRVEVHEAREFFRIRPTFWAPVHPHRVDGMVRGEAWGVSSAQECLTYGLRWES
jgi:hypothetical protein